MCSILVLWLVAKHQVEEFLATLAVEDLPGVGWTLKEKLHLHNLRKCCDLQKLSKACEFVIYS